jgi:hypothetical protein
MPITPGSPILASDINAVWQTALNTLRTRTTANNPYRQFTVVLRLLGINSTTSEHLRTITYVPRTDLVLRAAKIVAHPSTGGPSTDVVCTATIPAGIRDDESIVGGNINRELNLRVITDGVCDPATNFGTATLPVDQVLGLLAGDSVDVVVSTTAIGTRHDITLTLTVENLLTVT